MNKKLEYSNHRQLRDIHIWPTYVCMCLLLQCFDDSILFREFEIINLKIEYH